MDFEVDSKKEKEVFLLSIVKNMMNKIEKDMRKIKYIVTILMILISMALIGCSNNSESVYTEKSGSNTGDVTGDRMIGLLQENGKKLYLYLPFDLEIHEKFSSDDLVNNPESYSHTGNKMFVSIYHGSMVNPDMKVIFDMDTFMEAFENPEKFNPRLIKKEKRNINGKKVTYADIRADFYNEPFRAECIGIYSGNEFWTILYFYNEKDKESHEVVKKSIDSITIH